MGMENKQHVPQPLTWTSRIKIIRSNSACPSESQPDHPSDDSGDSDDWNEDNGDSVCDLLDRGTTGFVPYEQSGQLDQPLKFVRWSSSAQTSWYSHGHAASCIRPNVNGFCLVDRTKENPGDRYFLIGFASPVRELLSNEVSESETMVSLHSGVAPFRTRMMSPASARGAYIGCIRGGKG
ncbi:hypothetical protein BDN67DRAFT_972605 [Paxillus ammoniavirescens]|nr:hypothetical protein BDN67DRAFT_972605 [Paxillus ammoniavirescens]